MYVYAENNKIGATECKHQQHIIYVILRHPLHLWMIQTEILPSAAPAMILSASPVNWTQVTDTGSWYSDWHHSVAPVITKHTHACTHTQPWLVSGFTKKNLKHLKFVTAVIFTGQLLFLTLTQHYNITAITNTIQKCKKTFTSVHSFSRF